MSGQCTARADVPEKRSLIRGNFEQFSWITEPMEPLNVFDVRRHWRPGQVPF
jgi:hypothetical protein